MKLTATDPLLHTFTFRWRAYEVEQQNTVMLGYECKVYYDDITHTEIVPAFATTYTISLQWESQLSLPRAFSVSAITSAGVSDHTPQVKLNESG